MKRERRIPLLLLVVCVVAVVPFSWGAGGREGVGSAEPVNRIAETPDRLPPREAVVNEEFPMPAPPPEVPASRVPKTGQTGCWDQAGSAINCAGTGQDGEFQKGVSVDPRFTDNGDGTVKDNLTGLIWLKDITCYNHGMTWADALTASNTLADGACGLTDGSVAGDWRLPNAKELQSLFEYGGTVEALPPGHPFVYSMIWRYWSSTSLAYAPFGAYWVSNGNGEVGGEFKGEPSYRWWPVRGGR
jgi:hypothetical protein